MVVKTYPHPSDKYRELVCTAGVTSTGQWRRLYPVPFRLLGDESKFPKYAWLELYVTKEPRDRRPESYRIDQDAIQVLDRLGTDNGWAARRKVLDPLVGRSLCELEGLKGQDAPSLAIIKPSEILSFDVKPSDEAWPKKYEALLARENFQLKLFGEKLPALVRPLPYRATYRFRCTDPNCATHTKVLLDWEFGACVWNWLPKYGKDGIVDALKKKWQQEMCGPTRDTYFYVGTHSRFGNWLLLGVFWPPRTAQMMLF